MSANLQLFDSLTRHQVYLEGVKLGLSKEFNKVLIELKIEFKKQFSKLEYDTLDALTKTKLKSFLRKLKKIQGRIYNAYALELEKQIQDFMAVDLKLSTAIFETVTERKIKQAYEEDDGLPIWPLAAFVGSKKGNKKLWGIIKNNPIPANGSLLVKFIDSFINSASQAVENMVRMGYANRWKTEETLSAIIGTKSHNWRNGEFAKTYRQAAAVISTSLQHTSSVVQNGVSSIFYKLYVWVSVLDSNTTEICRRRNLKTYIYGKGPLPPAHIHCRSKAMPASSNVDGAPRTYYSWLKSQPPEVQNDILGKDRATMLRNGKLKSKDFSTFVNPKALTIDEFSKKKNLILTKS